MKVFIKVLWTIGLVAGTWISIMMIVGIYEEIKFTIEYPEYWDLPWMLTISMITLFVICLTIIGWYEIWLNPILDKDRAYTMRELTKQFDAIPSGQKKLNALAMWTFNELPFRKRKAILENIIKEMTE